MWGSALETVVRGSFSRAFLSSPVAFRLLNRRPLCDYQSSGGNGPPLLGTSDMRDPLPYPPLNARRTRARIALRMAKIDRAAVNGDPLAYCRADPVLDAYWSHLDRLAASA